MGVVRGWRGGFFFQVVFGVESGLSMQFLRGEGFFSIFPCFPMCSQGVPFKFLLGSQYVPQGRNVFLNMFSL